MTEQQHDSSLTYILSSNVVCKWCHSYPSKMEFCCYHAWLRALWESQLLNKIKVKSLTHTQKRFSQLQPMLLVLWSIPENAMLVHASVFMSFLQIECFSLSTHLLNYNSFLEFVVLYHRLCGASSDHYWQNHLKSYHVDNCSNFPQFFKMGPLTCNYLLRHLKTP